MDDKQNTGTVKTPQKHIVMHDGTKVTVKQIKAKIARHRKEIDALERIVEESGYDEPVECLSCDWTGYESGLDGNCPYHSDAGWDSYDNDGCPSCKSLGWEYSDE